MSGFGTISHSSGIVRFVQGGVVKTFRCMTKRMSLIDRIAAEAGSEFAEDFRERIDDALIADHILLYGLDSILERNSTYRVQEQLPNWFAIGDDSGGAAFLMTFDGTNAVYRQGFGAFSLPPTLIAASFREWIANDCPLPLEPKSELPMFGDLWLVQAPSGGLKDMLRLKNAFQLSSGLGALKEILASAPCLIEPGVPCGKYIQRAKDVPELLDCIAFSECGEDDPVLPLHL